MTNCLNILVWGDESLRNCLKGQMTNVSMMYGTGFSVQFRTPSKIDGGPFLLNQLRAKAPAHT